MLLWLLGRLKKLLKALNSDGSPEGLAGGAVIGIVLGFLPFNFLLSLIVASLLIFLRVHIGMGVFFWLLVRLLAPLLDALTHQIGMWVLVDVAWLQPLWKLLYSLPLLPYTQFNNSMMMGSILLSVVFWYPLYLGLKFLIVRYRAVWMQKINSLKIVKVLKASKWAGFVFRLLGDD